MLAALDVPSKVFLLGEVHILDLLDKLLFFFTLHCVAQEEHYNLFLSSEARIMCIVREAYIPFQTVVYS